MPPADDPKPFDDVRKGLGLLFRAARTAVKHLPTDPIEKVVVDGAREVGRAVENVATSIERELFGAGTNDKKGAPPTDDKADAPAPPDGEAKDGDESKPRPRVE